MGLFVLLLTFAPFCFCFDSRSALLDQLLMEGVANGTFPGAVGAVGDASGFIYSKAVGSFTYGSYPPQDPTSNPEVTLDSRFDMASLSKVVGATTAGAVLYQKGYFHILDKVNQKRSCSLVWFFFFFFFSLQ